MNEKLTHSKEIQTRMESELWSQRIAKSISGKYKRKQTSNRILISLTITLLFAFGISISNFATDEMFNSNLSELNAYRLFLSDDITPLYDSIYQEENLLSLIDPISYFVD